MTPERRSQIDFSFVSIRSQRLSLLALASTVRLTPTVRKPPAQKGHRDQIVFLKLYLLYRGSTRGFSFSITLICPVCFDKNPVKGEQRVSADPNSAAPRPPAALRQFLERPWLLKVGEPLSRHIELIG